MSTATHALSSTCAYCGKEIALEERVWGEPKGRLFCTQQHQEAAVANPRRLKTLALIREAGIVRPVAMGWCRTLLAHLDAMDALPAQNYQAVDAGRLVIEAFCEEIIERDHARRERLGTL